MLPTSAQCPRDGSKRRAAMLEGIPRTRMISLEPNDLIGGDCPRGIKRVRSWWHGPRCLVWPAGLEVRDLVVWQTMECVV